MPTLLLCQGSLLGTHNLFADRIAPAAPTTDSSGSPSSLWEEGAGHPAFPLSDFRRLPGQLRREPTAGLYSQNTGSRDRFSKTHSKYPFSLPRMANGSVCRLVFGTSSLAGSRSEMKPEVPPLPKRKRKAEGVSLKERQCSSWKAGGVGRGGQPGT